MLTLVLSVARYMAQTNADNELKDELVGHQKLQFIKLSPYSIAVLK